VRIELNGTTLADSPAALRILETSHPPTIYVPPTDIRMDLLRKSRHRGTWCEFKGAAHYLDALIGERRRRAIGWAYVDPVPRYAALRDHIAFYPSRVDAAYLDDELLRSQESDFYGGWITADLLGLFKGPPGTLGW
jgi:uncharacterized protein (DUF427 family)